MKLTINGEQRAFEQPVDTIENLLELIDVSCARTAVELNGAVIEQRLFGETALQDGDRLEIVSFVGGG